MPIHAARNRLQPPADLRGDAAALFRELVASCHPDHFVVSDRPLLVAYCEVATASRHLARQSRKNPKLVPAWERTVKMLATLATRLRLAPQARSRPEATMRRHLKHAPSFYDVMEE